MYLMLKVSNCSVKRSFSKLKLIKNRFCLSMCNDRLSQLPLMSTEADILREINFEYVVTDFAKRKARKVSLLKNLEMTSRVYFNHVFNIKNKSKFFLWLVGTLNLVEALVPWHTLPMLKSWPDKAATGGPGANAPTIFTKVIKVTKSKQLRELKYSILMKRVFFKILYFNSCNCELSFAPRKKPAP